MSEFSSLNGYKVKDKKATRFYDNVANMKNDVTLKTGMFVKTKGFNSANDGGSAYYHITDIEDPTKFQEQLNNELYAEVIDLISFKQMGKFETDISINDFNYLLNDVVDLENNTLVLEDTLELENIILKNGNISMGTSSTSIAPSKDTCLLVKSNTIIDNVNFSNINAYYTILSQRGSSNITIKNCKFIDNAFACIVFDVGNKNVKVDNCYFNGIKYTDTSTFLYRYFIATGSKYTKEQNTDYDFSIKNAEFTNNTLINNPLWEAIDTHGGENITIKNNYIDNCQTGIMCNCTDNIINNIKHKNIIIENNIMSGANDVTRTGIIVGGTENTICENVRINNNEIYNCSDINNVNFGSIKLSYITNAEIINNKINNSKTRGINLGTKCMNISIKNNYIENSTTAPIVQSGYACINIDIENNILNGRGACVEGFYNPLSGRGKFENNMIYGCTNNRINYPNNFNKCYNGSTNAFVNFNDILFDMVTNVPLKVTSQYFALGKATFNQTMTVTGDNNSNYVTCNITPNELFSGLEILIGSDAYTVDRTVGNIIYLTSNTVSAYTNATITPKAPTYASFS